MLNEHTIFADMIKAVFIDLDDTLWATRHNNTECLRELYHELDWSGGDIYPTFEDFFEVYDPNNEHLWALYREGEITKHELTLKRFGDPLKPVCNYSDEDIFKLNHRFLTMCGQKSKTIPHAIDLMKRLQKKYPTVIVSNGFVEVQYQKMKSAGLSPFIDHVVLSEQVGINKPSPIIFQKALSLVSRPPSEVVMIGDSWDADIVGALNTKIPAIWFNPNGLPMPETTKNVETISSLTEVEDAIREINKKLLKRLSTTRHPKKF